MFRMLYVLYICVSSIQKLALRESNISRYREEFHEVCVVGSGSFGTVYKCINRLDGCVYALKKSHKPVAGSPDELVTLRWVHYRMCAPCLHGEMGTCARNTPLRYFESSMGIEFAPSWNIEYLPQKINNVGKARA